MEIISFKLILFVVFIFLVISFYLTFFYLKKSRKLTPQKKEEFLGFLKQINFLASQKEKIIDYDKLYHKILLELGYKGSFGDILKQNPIIIKDIQKIWELHKIRNKLAHDFEVINEKTLSKNADDFKNEIINLIKNIS